MTAPYPSSAAQPRYRPGPVALLLVVAGVATAAIGFFALPWGSDNGVTTSFTRLRTLYDATHILHGLAAAYLKWLCFAGLAAAGACGLLAAFGAPTAAAANTRRAVGALAAGGAGILHLVAIDEIYDKVYGSPFGHVPAGPWVVLAGYGLIVAGALIGARR